MRIGGVGTKSLAAVVLVAGLGHRVLRLPTSPPAVYDGGPGLSATTQPRSWGTVDQPVWAGGAMMWSAMATSAG